ncbi:PEPxxWA-CTERM sorting domain-containing protein [Sphingomonas sp. MMS24-J13]|uniref:PEPxxWA-CTERM sorting domain-containing protein n=1 Tax=Sphingomonas sp. MMS24-J13 TaxID=3238686 RepID=UPI00384CCD3B
MRIRFGGPMRQCTVAIAWLITVSLALSPVNAAGFGQTTNDSGLLANNCSEESAPLPERPVLGRSTFASHAPHVPHKKAKPHAKKKTVAHKPNHAKKPTASKPPVTKPTAHKPIKKHPKKPSKPRKTLHKRSGGTGHDGGNKHAGKDALQRATFGSPICQDRAPVMQAFGVGDMDQPLGDEFARAVQDALSPQDNQFTNSPGGNRPQNPGSVFPNTPTLTPPGTPNTGPGGGPNPPPPPPPPAVPEPSSWALMILGFGAIGMSLRRRRRVQA